MNVPTCPDAEDALASCLLAAPDKVAPLLIGHHVERDTFIQVDTGAVVAVALDRWRQRKPVDPILIGGELKGVVDPHRMMQIVTCSAVPSAAEHYLGEVVDTSARRKLIRGCQEAARLASEDGKEVALTHIGELVQRVSRPTVSRPASIKELLKTTLGSFMEERENRDVKTGWACLDRISPVRMGDYVVIAAQAKGGKSTLAISYAAEVCKAKGSVLICSLEMPQGDVAEKMLSRESRVSLATMYTRKFNEGDARKLHEATVAMSRWNLEVRDDVYSIDQIAAAARMSHARKPLTMLVVDYLQLVRGPKIGRGDNREREVAEVSRTLRLLSLELGCVVVALSQLNDDGRLRESRAIGQDATAVWSVQPSENGDEYKNIQIPAQRNAESGVGCDLLFEGKFASFSEK
jgi:replicative DNA helicase